MDERDAKIGAYEIRGRLGAGGMGEVFLAYDARLRRHVAVKRLRHDVEMTRERRRRLRREARAAAGLSHPAIVQIHDIVEDDDGDSIVMEYVEGRSLDRLLAGGEVDVERAVELARQVAEGLAAAHERGVIHRDLKAENVMVMPDGRARILDFGLAKPMPFGDADATLTREGAVVGTLRNMSPEQAAGGEVDARSDLFSLGLLLYQALTGHVPYAGSDVARLYEQVKAGRVTPAAVLRPELPAPLLGLLGRLLERDPERRPGSAREVAIALAEIAASPALDGLASSPRRAVAEPAASDAPTALPESPRAPAERRRRRRAGLPPGLVPGLVAVALVAVALVAGGAAFFLLRPGPEPLRVLVLRPESPAGAELAALGAQDAALATLSSLRGVEPVDPSAVGEGPRTAIDAARAVAADEVVASTLDRRDGTLWVSLRRLDGASGRVLWSSGTFEVLDPAALHLQLANAVGSRLRRGYPRHRARPGFPVLEARDEDYAAFLELQRSSMEGRSLGSEGLARLDALLATSPRFLDAWLLAGSAARVDGQLDRARKYLSRARELAPDDPRALLRLAFVEIDAARLDEAEARIEELARLAPGDVRVIAARAELLEKQGRLSDAARIWRQVVDARPSWGHHLQLARVTMRLGEVDEARASLRRLLEISPANPLGLARLAYLEMIHGDLEIAERRYRALIEIRAHPSHFTNLGMVLYLQRRYDDAAASYRRALELRPGYRMSRLNLADAELAAGRAEEARRLYRELLDEVAGLPGARGLDEQASLVHAQCLARLGQHGRAVEIARETRRRHPEDAETALLAALVHTLAGEIPLALDAVERALEQGVQRRWLEVPEFDALRSEPRFAALLANAVNLPPSNPEADRRRNRERPES